MTLDTRSLRPQRIAIIGGGISGLAAAYLLSPHHRVTLYEAAPRLGGHARTVIAGRRRDQPVDTGFIVFNYANYPHLTQMFRELDVPVKRSSMSFGATIDDGRVEYGLNSVSAAFGQRRNALRPSYFAMLRDILRFNAGAEAEVAGNDMTIRDLVDRMRLGPWFQQYYLMPICGAIWSSPTGEIEKFPARALIQFFRNHALLGVTNQHQWWTVDGGSIEYVSRLERHLKSRACILRKGALVTSVARAAGEVTVHTPAHAPETFDQVIFACHSDDALRLLAKPTTHERAALSAIRYQDNRVVLHADSAQMPRRRACWSSWVYRADTRRAETSIGVSYWMNQLQGIPDDDPLFITLNPGDPVRDDLIYDDTIFRHPIFDAKALSAQDDLRAMQGRNMTWFAGAYTRHGFHEDGFASAVRIARALDRQPA